MRYRADLHCYLCSRSSATLEWEGTHPAIVNVTRAGHEMVQTGPQEARRVRCARCGGPTFVEEIEPIRVPQMVVIEPAKRGRPRKADKEREQALERELLARIA